MTRPPRGVTFPDQRPSDLLMRFHHTPRLLQWLPLGLTWRVRQGAPDTVYLTFDDGPIPEETPWVLEQLAAHNALATFFCVGQNLERNPAVAQAVVRAGHRLANHTHRHLRGRVTPLAEYVQDVARCQELLDELQPGAPRLLRPPYGEPTLAQARALRRLGYELVMWDVLTYDFDARLAPADCLRATLRHTRPGAIVLFHDSVKASRNLRAVLPAFLAECTARGYRFATLPAATSE